MRREPLTCPHCDAKMAIERPACLRCGHAIVREARPDTAAADRAARRRRLQLGAAAAGVALAALAVVGLIERARTVEVVPSTVLLAARTAALAVADADAEIVSTSTRQPEVMAEPSMTGAASAGSSAYQAGDFGTALARVQEALERDPNDADVLNTAGQVLVELDRAREAVTYFERAVVVRPGESRFRFNLAVALSRAGDFQRAATTYRTVIEATPDDARAHHNLGLALRQIGRNNEAAQAFAKATVLDPGEAPHWLGLALSLDRGGRAADAADAYERYVALDPSSAEAPRIRERIARLRQAGTPAGPRDPASSK